MPEPNVNKKSGVDTVLAFMKSINAHDVDALVALMTEDHEFIDSLGKVMKGREAMRKGWQSYFRLCPDYAISHEDIFERGDTVVAFGKAGGTISVEGRLLPENRWEIPAAWKAVVQSGRVKQWRVYAENKPVYDILARAASKK
jgi:ketosteroid isomerase-like protein